MNFSPIFRKSFVFSVLGHLSLLALVSLSFGRSLPSAASYAHVFFWGDYLRNYQVARPTVSTSYNLTKNFLKFKPQENLASKPEKQSFAAPKGYIKPHLTPEFGIEKSVFVKKAAPERFVRTNVETSMVFHPVLPYAFTLYFKDREVAHVELMFDIVYSQGRRSIDIKRKITSGNPEVDLLTMRNISHFISMQQSRFSPNNWQTVKIDLSAKQ